jgi:hypothetical protein
MLEVKKRIADEFTTEAQDDSIGLWSRLWRIREYTGDTHAERNREVAPSILSDMLRTELNSCWDHKFRW